MDRNDHTKVDLDNARLIPTPDLSRVRNLAYSDVQKDAIQYSIGEIEIMVFDDKELQSAHNEVALLLAVVTTREWNES